MIGSWVNSNSVPMAAAMSASNLDFLVLDVEHSPCSISDVFAMLQAAWHTENYVRVCGTDYSQISRYLDAGAVGIIAPLVNSREQAQALVQACYYPPLGRRGLGFCAANDWGRNIEGSTDNYCNKVFVQIEHVDALEHLDDILSVEGIDGAWIGPWDLSASMGCPGEFDDIKFCQALERIERACDGAGVACCYHLTKPDKAMLEVCIHAYDHVAYSLDITMVTEAINHIYS